MQPSHRIVQITDTHLFDSADGQLRGVNTARSLSRVIDDIRARICDAELVIASGDISQDDGAASYQRFRDLVSPLELPVYCLPGNHDNRAIMRDVLAAPPFYYLDSVHVGNWTIVCADSCIEGDAAGQIDDNEAQRLDSEIREAGDRHIAIVLHHPPVSMHSKWLDTVGLKNGPAWLEKVNSHDNVRLIVFGHVHQETDLDFGNHRIIGTPSTCAQFLPRSDDFALDVRPPAWRVIDLFEDGRIETELNWLDGDE